MLKRMLCCLAVLTLALSVPAKAQNVVLDGQYVGPTFSGTASSRAYWIFYGVSPDLTSQFPNATVEEAGELGLYYLGYFAPVYGSLELDDGNGNGLSGSLSVGGPLGQPWDGTFAISNGTGRYAGYTGGGTVTVAALDAPNPDHLTALTLKGSAGPPIPEPSTVLLLGSSGLAGLLAKARRRTA